MRTLCAADMVEISDTVQSGGFVDRLEQLVVDLECKLLDTLTPDQFATVQHLVQAAQILAEARSTLSTTASSQTVRAVRLDGSERRRAGRRRPGMWPRPGFRPTEA